MQSSNDNYIKHTTTCKKKEMNRKIIDLIDKIHMAENSQVKNDLHRIQDEIKNWQTEQFDPVSFNSIAQEKL